MSYKQLTLEDRHYIQCRLREQDSIRSIARSLNRSPSTISREIIRNCRASTPGYNSRFAQQRTKHRHRYKHKHRRFQKHYIPFIKAKLVDDRWSPELIAVQGKQEMKGFISHEAIYQWIWKMKFSQSKTHRKYRKLYTYLKHGRRKNKRGNTRNSRGNIPGRQWIDQRPLVANQRGRFGDMEADLVLSKGRKAGVLILLDRRSRFCYIRKLKNKTAAHISKHIKDCLGKQKDLIHTITFDNDYAFADHMRIAKQLKVQTYFTHPYTSQEKGSVENRIGQLRRFFPKGTDFDKVTHQQVKAVENKLNKRPMRMFEYLTPAQVKSQIVNVALIS